MIVRNYIALLSEIVETFEFNYKDVKFCAYVQFREGFFVKRTYRPTVCIGGRIFITYNEGEKILEIFDTKGNVNNWYEYFDLKSNNKMELGIYISKYLEDRKVEKLD